MNNEKKILILGATSCGIFSELSAMKVKGDLPGNVILVENSLEFKPTQLPPVVLPKINKPKPIEERGVIPF